MAESEPRLDAPPPGGIAWLDVSAETADSWPGRSIRLGPLALQISALPETRWVRREDVPEDLISAELEIYKAQAADKPESVRGKIAEGKLGKWYEGVVLLEQPWIRDGDRTIEQLRAELSVTTGENVEIKRFARFERGA